MSNPQEKQLNPAEEAKERIVITLKTFCVVTDEPEEFIEKLDQLCQEHCDTAGDYEELKQKSISINKIQDLKENYFILENCKNRLLVIQKCEEYGIL